MTPQSPKGLLNTPVGFTPTGLVVPLHLTEEGELLVNGNSPSFLDPIPLSARYSNTALAAGESYPIAYTVPASKIIRMTGISVRYDGTITTVTLLPYVNNGTNYLYLNRINPVVSVQWYPLLVNILLDAGWTIGCGVLNATLNDDMYVNYFIERVK